jgi:hypothetical protein
MADVAISSSMMNGQEIRALPLHHTRCTWSPQNAVDPIPVAGAEGVWFSAGGR